MTDATTPTANSASQTFSLAVNDALAATQVVPSTTLTVGQASVNITPVTASGGTGALSYAVSPALPAGLVFDAASGAITGSPSAASAAATYTVTVTDSAIPTANSASKTFSLAVASPITATQAIASRSHNTGDSVSFVPVTGSGGVAPLSYSISPTLGTTGLSFNSSTGAVSGLATRALGSTTFTVTITDANGVAAQNTFALTINGPLAANTLIPLNVLTVGQQSVSLTPVVGGGGTGTLSYSITPALPNGLTFNAATGLISGVANAVMASTTYTVKVKDSAVSPAEDSQTFVLAIAEAVNVTQQIASRVEVVGDVVDFKPVLGMGGTSPLTYSISPALGNGLRIDSSTGTITGTASSALNTTTYTVKVTDANGSTGSRTFTLAISGPLIAKENIARRAITAGLLENGNPAGWNTFKPIHHAGGFGAIAYSVSPALPSGMYMRADGTTTGVANAATPERSYTVTVTDSNAPARTASSSFLFVVNPRVAAGAAHSRTLNLGEVVDFAPVDFVGGTNLRYTISPALPPGLSMDSTTGRISGSPTSPLLTTTYMTWAADYWLGSRIGIASGSFTITVNGALVATQRMATMALTSNQTGINAAPVQGGGGVGALSHSISPALPVGLNFNTSTGAITNTGSAIAVAGTTRYTVTVTDQAAPTPSTATNSFDLTVNAPLVADSLIPTQAATVADTVSFTPVAGSGGTGARGYSVSPALTNGLVLNSATGEISGTVVAPANRKTYTVTVSDANNVRVSMPFILDISGSLAATPRSDLHLLAAYPVGMTSYVLQPVVGSGGVGALSYSVAPALPAGMSINSTTGVISGVPTAATPSTVYTITVTDSDTTANTASAAYALRIAPALALTTVIPENTLALGEAVNFTPVERSADSLPALTVSPTLPAGLTFNTVSGTITGSPSVPKATTTYTVRGCDTLLPCVTATFTLTAQGQMLAVRAIASTVLTIGQSGVWFTPVTAQFGVGALRFSIAPALPAGLVLNTANGTVSGTPTAMQPDTVYTITVTDSASPTAQTAGETVRLAVNAAPVLSAVQPSQVIVAGDSANFAPASLTGGTAPISYSIAPGLGNGLALDPSTGQITGLVLGTLPATTYSVTATDANGVSSSTSFSMTVAPLLLAERQEPFVALSVGQSGVNVKPVTGSGGSGTITYEISPALPAGLNFNATTGAITGTAVAAMVTTTYTVTVSDGATPPRSASNTFSMAITP